MPGSESELRVWEAFYSGFAMAQQRRGYLGLFMLVLAQSWNQEPEALTTEGFGFRVRAVCQ